MSQALSTGGNQIETGHEDAIKLKHLESCISGMAENPATSDQDFAQIFEFSDDASSKPGKARFGSVSPFDDYNNERRRRDLDVGGESFSQWHRATRCSRRNSDHN